ncbi:DUF769 domain-containing protein [Pseudomonas sp. C1C7]|uniref:DUF769 domain-containing protein n=1 Tax=Pseudomonas sp. C1C7 TaxID=2735272 RepID=UPI00355737A2
MAGLATIWGPCRRGWSNRFIDADRAKTRWKSTWSHRTASHKTKTSGLSLADQITPVSKGRCHEKRAR